MNINVSKMAILISFVYVFSLAASYSVQGSPGMRANGKIAFTSDRDGNAEIYLMNADGSGQTRLTNGPASNDYPIWSPDGTKIAFLRQDGGSFTIKQMNPDGTNERDITAVTSLGIFWGMSWSPDGAKIAFQDSTDIFTINMDGSNRVNLTNGQFINYEPAWSPDGSRIAFSRSLYSHGYYPNIKVMNADGSNVQEIASCQGYCATFSPNWSPDSTRIAFTFSGDSDLDGDSITLVDPSGANIEHITAYGIENPKWSPDGEQFVSNSFGYSNVLAQIWVANRDGSGQKQLTTSSSNNYHPDWQPLAAAVGVTNLEGLYAAVNNPLNAGNQIAIAPGVYTLSANDPSAAARPNGGRLELQNNMSLIGVVGDRGAVIIDAVNLPTASYSTPITNTGAIRMGVGSNAVEWLTIRNATKGGAGIIAHLSAPGTANVRIAHVASTGNPRGIDIRNVGSTPGLVLNAELIDNDLYNNRAGTGPGLRIVNIQGVAGSVVNANLSGNRSYNNYNGLILENTGSTNFGSITFVSSGDRFYDNGLGALVGGGLGTANGNTVNFTANGTTFENNNGFSPFDAGGLLVLGAENTVTPNGSSNNTVKMELRSCKFSNNQLYDISALGARSNPVSIGAPGMNNVVNLKLYGTQVPVLLAADSSPASPGSGNAVKIIRATPFDFDGDGRSDIGTWRDATGLWWVLNSTTSLSTSFAFGSPNDRIVPGDYDGDGKTDYAVWRPSTGIWYLQQSSSGFKAVQFGVASDLPAQGDFDGDGRTDIAVFRPSNGTWYVLQSTAGFAATQFGTTGDKPVAADYDGDGKADLAVFRPSDGTWYQSRSTLGFAAVQFGISTDKVVPADYDGDGKADLAVYRDGAPGVWYLLESTGGFVAFNFGTTGDIPVPADYDGDGKADFGVFRSSSGTWFLQQSMSGFTGRQFGSSADKPVESSYVPSQ